MSLMGQFQTLLKEKVRVLTCVGNLRFQSEQAQATTVLLGPYFEIVAVARFPCLSLIATRTADFTVLFQNADTCLIAGLYKSYLPSLQFDRRSILHKTVQPSVLISRPRPFPASHSPLPNAKKSQAESSLKARSSQRPIT